MPVRKKRLLDKLVYIRLPKCSEARLIATTLEGLRIFWRSLLFFFIILVKNTVITLLCLYEKHYVMNPNGNFFYYEHTAMFCKSHVHGVAQCSSNNLYFDIIYEHIRF